jgi:hypothetical protein
VAGQYAESVKQLYNVPIDGGTAIKLNDTLALGGIVYTSLISPDSSRVVYLAEQEAENVREIYSVPIDGGVITKLNSPV